MMHVATDRRIAEMSRVLRSLRRFVVEEIEAQVSATCYAKAGAPYPRTSLDDYDLASMDDLAKPHYRRLLRLRRKIDKVLA